MGMTRSPDTDAVARSILIVEDEGVVAMEIQSRLAALGYRVAGWVARGEDAVAKVAESPPDLVLMDIRLKGGIDGIEAAERIRAKHRVPVVFLTAFDDEATLGRAKAADVFGYILKPFSERDLRTTIEIALYKHRLETALRDREQWLATTLGSIGDAVVATDTQGRVTYLNPVAEELTGWPLAEARGLTLAEVLVLEGADSGEAVDVPLQRALERGERVDVVEDCALLRRDGSRMPVSDSGAPIIVSPISTGNTGALGAVLAFRDISAKKEAERQVNSLNSELREANLGLIEQKGFLDALFECVPCSVVVVGQDRRIVMANRHFRTSFDVADDELHVNVVGEVLGCQDAILTPGACGRLKDCISCGVNSPILGALQGRTSERIRSSFSRKQGSQVSRMTFMSHAAPLDFRGERLAIVILEDVTELTGLRQLLGSERSFAGIVGSSPKMREIYDTIREIADLTVPVMILGESGTGKELVARAIHDRGGRSGGSFVPVNCGALPDGLLESELFGHVRGAFTGAVRDRKGRFELAHGGTIFLDEVGELSQAMQVKLLRVLQEGTFERVGGERTSSTDARVVCATNRDLEHEVAEGRFREDLYYRLCVMPIRVPPLRERLEDVPLIAEYLIEKESATARGRQVALSVEVVSRFMTHDWPGNVRELQNVLTYGFIKCKGSVIGLEHLPPSLAAGPSPGATERRSASGITVAAVASALAATGGNKVNAAKELGVSRATLYRFLAEHPHLYDAR